MRRLVPAMLVFAVVAAIGLAVFFTWQTYPWLFSGHYVLRIAVPPLSGSTPGARFATAFKRELAHEHPRVQVELVPVPAGGSNLPALKENKADLAVGRSDDPDAAEGRSVFVLRKLYAVVLVAPNSPVEALADLANERIGVIPTTRDAIDPLAKTLLDFYQVGERRIVRLAAADVGTALRAKRIGAVLVVGPAGPGPIAEAVQVIRKTFKKPPTFLDLVENGAISARYPAYEAVDLPDGAFGGTPAAPDDDVKSLAASLILFARPTLSNYAAGELTRLLLATKSKIAATVPGAGELAAPATDRDVVLPAHPGTIAYLNGDEPDLLDESTNYIYAGSLITGAVGSVAAWITSLRNRRRLRDLQANFARLPVLLGNAKAPEPDGLDATEEELDRLSEWFVEKYVSDEISPDVFTNAANRVAHVRALIQRRRTNLALPPPDSRASPA